MDVPNNETSPDQSGEPGTEIETDIAKELEEAADIVQPEQGDDSVWSVWIYLGVEMCLCCILSFLLYDRLH